ncbi:UNVERIFIED_CONTAM: hypothetical protein Sradi_1509000 [Sesamum radiatum]|uniref:Secreted protein n=1 Tax=Sesamum radiatum TaxID=300843 RepID=A0AAW2U919_SESRA
MGWFLDGVLLVLWGVQFVWKTHVHSICRMVGRHATLTATVSSSPRIISTWYASCTTWSWPRSLLRSWPATSSGAFRCFPDWPPTTPPSTATQTLDHATPSGAAPHVRGPGNSLLYQRLLQHHHQQ